MLILKTICYRRCLNHLQNDKATSDELNRRFGSKTITTADAFNVITQDECIRRFKAMGDYDSFTFYLLVEL